MGHTAIRFFLSLRHDITLSRTTYGYPSCEGEQIFVDADLFPVDVGRKTLAYGRWSALWRIDTSSQLDSTATP